MSLTSRLLLSAALTSLALPAGVQAQSGDPVDNVLACRAIADIEARLACFDQTSAALETARSTGDILIVEREAVENVERDSFGFSLPSLPSLSLPSLASRRPSSHDALASADPAPAPTPAPQPAQPASPASPATSAPTPAPTPAPAPVQVAEATPQRPAVPPVDPETGVQPEPEDATEMAEEEVRITARDRDGNVDTVTMRIERTRTVGYDTTIFYMTNGQVWRQTDDGSVRIWGDGPHYAEIRRGAMDSYLLRINGRGRAIRVRRQN
ncbi:hypothetical protein [Maricaulis parjimensis]|uniref:hypothetical protein n=1 Tax=Maricaulis parjimensis TaxID=144023 RepID=UPI001939EB32|nr:hypothetical protein [Maricaulis parjimensis]